MIYIGIIYAVGCHIYVNQFLSCVAPNVNYHLPKSRGMIRGVAVRLQEFLEFLDKHGIPHMQVTKNCEEKIKVKRNKRCAVRMKQYFLKKGMIISSRGRSGEHCQHARDAFVFLEMSLRKGLWKHLAKVIVIIHNMLVYHALFNMVIYTDSESTSTVTASERAQSEPGSLLDDSGVFRILYMCHR